ncbi:MAG: hypothetical protein ACI3Z0_10250 [Candidatus Cryptobacteroides sp.]
MKKFIYVLFAAIVAASCTNDDKKVEITGAWSYVSGTVEVDGVAVPSDDAEHFIDMETAIFTFNEDGTLKYQVDDLGDNFLTGDYSLDRKTMRLDLRIDNDRVTATVLKLTKDELVWDLTEEVNVDYSNGDFHYNTADKHILSQKWKLTRLQ